MVAKNRVVEYAAGSTKKQVLEAVRDELTSNCGFTILEDAITASDYFVVQNQNPSNTASRIIFYLGAIDGSGFSVLIPRIYAAWNNGDASRLNRTRVGAEATADRRGFLLGLRTGGRVYLDCDTNGDYLILSLGSQTGAQDGMSASVFPVCLSSIEKTAAEGNLGVNYGALVGFSENYIPTNREYCFIQSMDNLSGAGSLAWIPPEDHIGAAIGTNHLTNRSIGPICDAGPAIPYLRHAQRGRWGADHLGTGSVNDWSDRYAQRSFAPQFRPILIQMVSSYEGTVSRAVKPLGSTGSLNSIAAANRGYAKGILIGGTDNRGLWRTRGVLRISDIDFVILRSKYREQNSDPYHDGPLYLVRKEVA